MGKFCVFFAAKKWRPEYFLKNFFLLLSNWNFFSPPFLKKMKLFQEFCKIQVRIKVFLKNLTNFRVCFTSKRWRPEDRRTKNFLFFYRIEIFSSRDEEKKSFLKNSTNQRVKMKVFLKNSSKKWYTWRLFYCERKSEGLTNEQRKTFCSFFELKFCPDQSEKND